MEITEIQSTKQINRLKKNEGVTQTNPQDQLCISSESEKKAEWVEMLHKMPEIRLQKIEEGLYSSPSSLELAYNILNDM